MKKSIFTILLSTVVCLTASSQTAADIRQIYDSVDREIEHWPAYVARRQARIDSLTSIIWHEKDVDRWYDCCAALVDEYSCFQNDSAIFYATKLRETAPWTSDQENVVRAKITMANQAVRSGMYEAALTWLADIDTTAVSKDSRVRYEQVAHFAYVEMAAYCYIWDKRAEYMEEEHECRVVLLSLLTEDSPEWLLYKAYDELLADQYQQADSHNRQCLSLCEKYGPLYRDASFHQRFICESLGQKDEAAYWLAECAISEIRMAMNDQTALWSLAEKMGDDQLERSYRYIRFAWDAISRYGVNVRKWNISPVLSSVEHRYQAQMNTYYRVIAIGALVLLLLTILLALTLWYVNRQRHQLAEARNSLERSNHNLLQSNRHLADASRAKEKYIVQLLGYAADFINKKEDERRTLSKMQRTGKEKELTKMLNAADKTDKELGLLLDRFDEIFLELYPTFINDFNELIAEDKRIGTRQNERMNTPLRIFALMRLGINNTQDVSRMLHCSAQTVYNYRNNYRNAFLGDRERFEEAIREIGMPDLVDK